jgi:hypothetical protein
VTAADPNGSGGTLLASKTMVGAPTPAAWNVVSYDTPVAVVTTKLYKTSVFSGDGRYVLTTNFFTGDLVNGDLTSDANGDNPIGLGNLNNGSFTIAGSNSYPTNGGPSCYFADVVFEAAGDPSVIPDGLAVPVTLGAPTAGILSTTPDGLAVPVAFGEPTVSLLAATPTSVAVPVALGEPSIGATTALPVVPDSINVTVTLGEPASEDGPAAARSGGGWMSYGNALRQNAEELRRERETPPVECPNDGYPLEAARGVLHCRFDGWQWPAKRIVDPTR